MPFSPTKIFDHATPMMSEVTAEDKIRYEYMRNSIRVILKGLVKVKMMRDIKLSGN